MTGNTDRGPDAGGLSEFELIDRIAAILSDPGGPFSPEVGIGDDCAVVRFGEEYVLLACDMLVEGRHFLQDAIDPEDLGYKALAINVSDVAAMGGVPAHALVGLSLPPGVGSVFAERLARGIAEAAREYGVSIVGGDTTGGDAIVLDVSVTGTLPCGRAVTRAGARPGDALCVTGSLGGSDGGLRVLLEQRRGVPISPVVPVDGLVQRHRRPQPRVAAGVAAARYGVTAMIDVSDGFLADVGHIASRSGVAVDVQSASIPLSPGLAEAAAAIGFDALTSALTGGEDYELALTVPYAHLDKVAAAILASGTEFTVVGKVDKGQGVTLDGEPVVGDSGWDHFGRRRVG